MLTLAFCEGTTLFLMLFAAKAKGYLYALAAVCFNIFTEAMVLSNGSANLLWGATALTTSDATLVLAFFSIVTVAAAVELMDLSGFGRKEKG